MSRVGLWSPAPRGGRVLVVDDNQDAAITLATLLELSGYRTRTAHDGLQALEMARGFAPQVCLLDIGLPLLGGHELAERLRGEPGGADLVLVALTGWGCAPDRAASQAAGFDAHLVKPVEPDALLHLLAELVARRAMAH
jgi:CheY-like chemotaxis protein